MARSPSRQPAEDTKPSRWQRVQDVASAAALLFSIIGGGALAVGAAVWLWIPELRAFSNTVMLVGLGLLLVALASSFVSVRKALAGQRGRYAANAIVMVGALIVTVVFVNFLTFRSTIRLDTTATRQFSLSQQTLAVLDDLDQPVRATAFFIPGSPQEVATRQRADDLMFEYQSRSGNTFTYRFVDPDADPSTARELGVSNYPAILFEAMDTGQRFTIPVPPLAEQDLTTALLIVTGTERKLIYFLSGHGEKDPGGLDIDDGNAYGLAARGLLQDGYGIQSLNLSVTPEVPDNAAVLVIAGPKREMRTAEEAILLAWLKDGGRALFLLDPRPPNSFQNVLENWGIEVAAGTVVDKGSSLIGDPRSPLLQRGQYMPDIPITSQLDATLFPQTAPVRIVPEENKRPPWILYAPLASTTILSWATADPDRDDFDGALGDLIGPHFIAIALLADSTLEEEPPGYGKEVDPLVAPDPVNSTSIVVFGDSDFASNAFYGYSTNKDFLLNTVNWLAQDYDLISIRPKAFSFRNLVVTRSEFDFIRYTSWFMLPTVMAFMGLAVWWRRR